MAKFKKYQNKKTKEIVCAEITMTHWAGTNDECGECYVVVRENCSPAKYKELKKLGQDELIDIKDFELKYEELKNNNNDKQS